MENKITTIRIPEKYNEYLETIRNEGFKYMPEEATTTDLILFAIAYTAKQLNKDPE